MNKLTMQMDVDKDCFIASLPVLTLEDREEQMMYYSIENFTHTRVYVCLEEEIEDPEHDIRFSIYSKDKVYLSVYQINEITIHNVGKEALVINNVRIEPQQTHIFTD